MARLSNCWRTLAVHSGLIVCAAVAINGLSVNSSELTATTVAFLQQRLEHAETINERFAVLTEIRAHAKSRTAPTLVDAVSKHTHDVDVGIRCAAILTLAHIAFEHATDCPRELIAGLIDSDAEVRRAASENIVPDVYASLPDNVIEVAQSLLNDATYRDVRSCAPTLLQYYSRDSTKASSLLKKATADKDFLVRNNAAAALLARGESVESAISFFVQSAYGEPKREFYSSKLGWSQIDDKTEVGRYQKFHRQILRDAAKKYPVDVLRELSKRLQPQERDSVATMLAQITTAPRTQGHSGSAKRSEDEIRKRLNVLTRDTDSHVSALARFSIDQLLTSDVSDK